MMLSLLLWSCGKEKPSLENFDQEKWLEDRNACKGNRGPLVEPLLTQKDKLLGLDELAIVDVLGKPDENELYKRNQKFFYYYVTASKECGSENGEAKKLVIRFNAVGLAKEILVE